MNAIEMEGITKRYEHFELKDLNLTVPEGMILGLVGENGAGKTTALRILLQMTKPDAGRVRIMGEAVSADDPAWKAPEEGSPDLLKEKTRFVSGDIFYTAIWKDAK